MPVQGRATTRRALPVDRLLMCWYRMHLPGPARERTWGDGFRTIGTCRHCAGRVSRGSAATNLRPLVRVGASKRASSYFLSPNFSTTFRYLFSSSRLKYRNKADRLPTSLSKPRLDAWSFLCSRRWSVRCVIVSVMSAIWTSGEPVSFSWTRKPSTIWLLGVLAICIIAARLLTRGCPGRQRWRPDSPLKPQV